MKLLLAVLGLSLVAGAPALGQTAQSLSISLHGDGAQATQLPQYDPAAPIAVHVMNGDGRPPDALTIVAVGPAGERLRAPLARAGDGTFSGTITLGDEGSWRVNLAASSGSVRTDTTPVTLDVEAPPPSNAWMIGLAVGAAIFLMVGGSGFLLLRRLGDAGPTTDLGNAA
jgi:hypothetical protein